MKTLKDKHIAGLKYSLRMKVFDEDQMHDIKDFEINNSKNNKFISSVDDMEFCIKDGQYFIIPGSTFEQIIEDLYKEAYEQGIKDSKKSKKQKEEALD